MDWVRKKFKKNKVYVWCDEAGNPVVEGGKVRMRYKPEDEREYSPAASAIRNLDDGGVLDDGLDPMTDIPKPDPCESDRIVVYTDGASRGNPGEAGLGVVLISGNKLRDIGRYMGKTTNNVAELTAIKVALSSIRRRDLPVYIHTDSTYARGVLTKGWKAKANVELIEDIRRLMQNFNRVTIDYIEGHAGHYGNERADKLANVAIDRKGSVDRRDEITDY